MYPKGVNMARNLIYHDVRGAPFEIDDRVRILNSKDETLSSRFVGRIGFVKYLEYGCGCGQSYPGDPMIGVQFRRGRKRRSFGKRETEALRSGGQRSR